MNAPGSARERRDRALRIALPIVVLALGLAIWEAAVRIENIPPYVLPGPGLILRTLVADWALLSQSLLVTLLTTFEGFLLAAVGGVGLGRAVQPIAAPRIFALSLRGDPAGDADRRHRAAVA